LTDTIWSVGRTGVFEAGDLLQNVPTVGPIRQVLDDQDTPVELVYTVRLAIGLVVAEFPEALWLAQVLQRANFREPDTYDQLGDAARRDRQPGWFWLTPLETHLPEGGIALLFWPIPLHRDILEITRANRVASLVQPWPRVIKQSMIAALSR